MVYSVFTKDMQKRWEIVKRRTKDHLLNVKHVASAVLSQLKQKILTCVRNKRGNNKRIAEFNQFNNLNNVRVHIVCYEPFSDWILGKIALELFENITSYGVQCTIGNKPDPQADINHHICYVDYNGMKTSLDTVMITHVDAPTAGELDLLKYQMQSLEMAVCMSSDTMNMLAAHGVPKSKLCYINPAHDDDLPPRKIKIGVFHRIYPDGRKREGVLLDLMRAISPYDFTFIIMGSGWGEIASELRSNGFQVLLYEKFNRKRYRELLELIDYYLYMGVDEGSMGFVDALACGIPTIVTEQGFHKDASSGVAHFFSDSKQLIGIFSEIASLKRKRESIVKDWTWQNYAIKHLIMWDYVVSRKHNLQITDSNRSKLIELSINLTA